MASASNDSKFYRLASEVPGLLATADQIELFQAGAILLHDQGRVDDVVAASSTPFGLEKHELFWVALRPYLLDLGYEISSRYSPGWRYTGPAVADVFPPSIRDGLQASPAERAVYAQIPDAKPLSSLAFRTVQAVRLSTHEHVVIKILCTRPGRPEAGELALLQFLNAEPQRSRPDNVCVPLLDVLELPSIPSCPKLASDFRIVVMPELQPVYDSIPTCTIRAYPLHLLRQALDGLAFLHSLGIAHRDIVADHIMTTPGGPPHKVYFIDFGLATRHEDLSAKVGWVGGQLPPPEILYCEPKDAYNPFMADVYNLGLVLSMLFDVDYPRTGTLYQLGKHMRVLEPKKRCTAEEAATALRAYVKRMRLKKYFVYKIPYSKQSRFLTGSRYIHEACRYTIHGTASRNGSS
ncbi:hypothetical protein EXIGLDRAFT_829271 [Exidia glandulosa HHB12029]|uniref:Protein kinase domain-containing protein n=1 Tax=Exidia glandulosa HHB12029 TaxID=1314781 RepID=A0A165PMA6_EXIGL|nr:hypothetical protein EXIGLDRAFT_829271 [Exidia glandulosa HHB12029]